MILSVCFWLLLPCRLLLPRAAVQSAGGEAWPLSLIADGTAVPVLLKITTSGMASYDTLMRDLGLRLRLVNTSIVTFEPGLSLCGDVLLETQGLPAPKDCTTGLDGSDLSLVFYRDGALRPSTTYFFVVHLRYYAQTSTEKYRTIFVETFDDYLEIDTFGFVLPDPIAAGDGPQLHMFEVSSGSTVPFANGELFSLSVTLSTSGGASSVNVGLGDSVIIWANPMSIWDFSAVAPCILEITGDEGAGAGTCNFLRFPSSDGAEVLGAFGLNAVEVKPTEQVGSTPLTFTLRLVAPAAGGAILDQHQWYAQALRNNRPTQQLIRAPVGPEVVLHPTAAVARVSNAAAGAIHEVDVVFTPGGTFHGRGEVRIRLPASFAVYGVTAEVFGYGRLSGSYVAQIQVSIQDSVIAMQLPSHGAIYGDAQYAARIRVQNPSTATFPTACVPTLSRLATEEIMFQQFSVEPFETGNPENWQLEVDVGFPAVLSGSTTFMAFNVLPLLRGANLAPTQQNIGFSANVLQVFFRLTVGLLTRDVEIELKGPSEFVFSCSEFVAPAVPFTYFPSITSCATSPGTLSVSLAPAQYYSFDDPLSFSVVVQNPTESEAQALARKVQLAADPSSAPLDEASAAIAAQSNWALFVKIRSVVCQSNVELTSPYQTDTWELFLRTLTIERLLCANPLPRVVSSVILNFKFTQLLPSGSTVTLCAPYGFQFLAEFQVDAVSTGAEDTFPVGLPILANPALPHELVFTLVGSARASTRYGFRAEIMTAPASPTTQEVPSANVWSMAVSTTEEGLALEERLEAGTFPGFQITALQGCRVDPSDVVFGSLNDVTVSFVVHRSVYSTGTVDGTIQVTAPYGFQVPQNCVVKAPHATLDKPQSSNPSASFRPLVVTKCQGAGQRAIISIDPAAAIITGSHVRFRLEVVNAMEEPVSNTWAMSTAHGSNFLEECERPAQGFAPLAALTYAIYSAGGVGEDLRPGHLSVYRLAFIYPAQVGSTDADIGADTRSIIRVTVPEGFQLLATCLKGASGAAGELDGEPVSALPNFVACVAIGRVAEFTLAGLVLPETLYALSIVAMNPGSDFPYVAAEVGWLLEVDGAARGGIDAPLVQLLESVWLRLGDARALSDSHWAKVHFRTATVVPSGGGISVLMPFPFRTPTCEPGSWGLYDASSNELGGDALAAGSGCAVVPGYALGSQNRVLIYPLTEQLQASHQYLLTLLIGNGELSAHTQDPSGWEVSTIGADGAAIDSAPTLPSPTITRDLGSMSFLPPALSNPPGEAYTVDVEFTLILPARRGAVVFYPPPTVRVGCPDPSDVYTDLPEGTVCSLTDTSIDAWEGQQLVLRSSYNPWASTRPYRLRMQVYNTESGLPVYRRSWIVDLIEGLPTDTTSLAGFTLGTRAMEQWLWRGQLQSPHVSSEYPALNRRSTTIVHFSVVLPLASPDAELWVRPPSVVQVHAGHCFWSYWMLEDATADEEYAMLVESLNNLVPVYCEVPEISTDPCAPAVWETMPCADSNLDAVPSSHEFSHRQGLRVVTGDLAAGSYVTLSLATTPYRVANDASGESSDNVWTLSTWQGDVEQDVAQAAGYAIRNWIDVVRFEPSSLLPEVDVTIHIEWWMLISLEARGRVAVIAPSSGSQLFDLSSSADGFDAGNLPGAELSTADPDYPRLEVLIGALEVSLCCELIARTRYRLKFGTRNPPFAEMPAPSAPELNTWTLETRAPPPSHDIVHQQMLQGYRLSKSFQSVEVSLYNEYTVGGVGEADLEGKVQVSADFMLPFATAIHGPSAELRLLAPQGWEFPVVCVLANVRLGPYTDIGNCRASGRELVLSIVGSVNPGIENMVFGFVAAVHPPMMTPLEDVWHLQASAPVGSQEGLYDDAAAMRPEGGELEFRLTSPALGMARPSESGAFDPSAAGISGEMLMRVELTPRLPQSFWESFRRPSDIVATVRLLTPTSLSPTLVNATVRLTAPQRYVLHCAFPPESFQSGTLPPGIQCFDHSSTFAATSGLVVVEAPYELMLSVDNLITLQPSSMYEFSINVETPPIDYTRAYRYHNALFATRWRVALEAGDSQFRSVPAASEGAEGEVEGSNAIRDFGLLTSSTTANVLTEVSLLFSLSHRLRLPLALEVVAPLHFRFDSAPSPLHPALQPAQGGINPFVFKAWQERAKDKAEEEAQQIADGEDVFGVPCSYFGLTSSSLEPLEVATAHGVSNGTMCESPPTLDETLLAPCAADTYVPLPAEQLRCGVFARRAVVKVYPIPLREYVSAASRDAQPCTGHHCESDFSPAWLHEAQYRLSLSGFNPPSNPPVNEDMWALTISSEVPFLGGGPRNVFRPLGTAVAPNYVIGGSQSYSHRVSPEGGEVIRGGEGWLDTEDAEVPSVMMPPSDTTKDGRVILFYASSYDADSSTNASAFDDDNASAFDDDNVSDESAFDADEG